MRHSQPKTNQTLSNFITKTYKILENINHEEIIGWSAHGNSFLIKNIKQFEEQILPQYFKHSNFSSFVRQLNMYNFHKIRNDGDDCEFLHERFKRGYPELLVHIRRKQSELLIQSQNGIGELGPFSDSPEKNRISKPMSEEYLDKENGQKINERDLLWELEGLQKENRQLKIAKQIKILNMKNLNAANLNSMGEKFFKLLTSLITQKLKAEINKSGQWEHLNSHLNIFDDIVEHVMNTEESLTFEEYGQKACQMEGKKTEQQFMMGSVLLPNHHFI